MVLIIRLKQAPEGRDPRSTSHIVPQNVLEVVVALACGYFQEYHPTVTVACGETQSQTVILDTLDYAYSNDKGLGRIRGHVGCRISHVVLENFVAF